MSAKPSSKPEQLALDFPALIADGEEDFLVASSNQEAVDWLERWPNWPSGRLVLCGPAGSGKSHLCRLWRRRSGAVDGTSLEADARIAVLGEGKPLCLDINGRVADEEALLHAINWAGENSASLLITGIDPPIGWGVTLPDLRSRLQASAVAVLGAPDDALLPAVLVKLFADRQLQPSIDVLSYITERTERSFDAARRLVARVDNAALAKGRKLTVPLVREVLEDA